MVNNRIILLERFPNMVKFDLAYGQDIKDEAFLLAGSAAANRWFMNSNLAAGPGEEPDFKMIAGASFLGGMGGLIAANQLGRVAASKFVKTVDNIGLALVSGGASLKSINAILDTEIKDPKLKARVKKDILKLSKREFIKIQEAARQFNETVDSIMEINKFIPEGGEKLNREDVKVSVFHLFGVGLEASVDYAMTTIDTSKVKDIKNILKLRQEVLKRDEERALVVGKVINQIFPYKENLSEDASSTLDILAQMNEIKRVTSENDLESLKYAIGEIRKFSARSSGLASSSDDVEANITLRDALQDGIDRGEINPAILDDEEIADVIDTLQKEADEIIAINRENHEFIKDSIDNVVNTLEGKTLGALMRNDLDNFKADASKKYNTTRDSFIEENIGVTVKVDDFRDLTNANAQYRNLDFAEEVNFRSRAESDADILDEPEDLMSDTTSRETNPDAYNSTEYIDNAIKDSKDKGTLREIQKFSLGPTRIERLNAIFEPAAKRALIELYEYIGEENSHLFLTQTHRLFLSLPENLKKRFPIKSGRFIEVYDFHRNFSKALADGKITRDELGENANTLLNNYSTLELMNKDPARYAEGLALELNFKEIIVLRQALVKKKNKLFTQQDRSRERETVEQVIRDLDTVIKTNGIDKTKGEAADGEAIIEQFENLSSIWQDRSIRYSRNHKGEDFYENKSSKILEALEKKQFERVQQLVVETFGGSTNLNNILLETKEGQHLVKIYGGVQGPKDLYYPTEETAKSLRFILRAAYANAYKETKAGVALYRALEEDNVTNIPGVYNQRGFEILKERMGADPETGASRTYPLLKTSNQIEAFHQNVQNIPIYSVGDDGRVLINKDTGEPIAVTTLDANSDIVPLADINVLARLEKNVKEIKKQERQLRKIASAYRISHNLTASKLSNIARGFDPTAGNLNYDDIMGTALTDTGFRRWSEARALLSKADQEKWDTLSSDLLSLHIGKRIRGGLAGDDVLDFREVENILNDQQMVDYINKIDSNVIPSLTKLKELGEFLYPPTHALRAGAKPIPFRPESMFSKVYGLKNNKVSPTFVTAEFLFRANKQRKYNAQTYLVTHPEFANALYEYATKKSVMSIDVGKDHMAKVVSYFGRQVAMQSFYSRGYGDYMPKVTITGPKSKFGDRLETPENPRELLNQFKKIKQMQQTSLQTQGVTQ